MPTTALSTFQEIIFESLITILGGRYYCCHPLLTNVETKAQRGWITCPKVTQLPSGRARIWTEAPVSALQTTRLECLHFLHLWVRTNDINLICCEEELNEVFQKHFENQEALFKQKLIIAFPKKELLSSRMSSGRDFNNTLSAPLWA